MAKESSDPTAGGGSNPLPSITDYLDPEADTLLGRVDFTGMVAALFRGWVLGILSVITGVVVAGKRAFFGLYEDFTEAGANIWDTLMAFPGDIQSAAVETASAELQQFGILAGPVAQGIVLVGLAGVAFIIVVIVFGGDG